jgi:hypothetical protein
MAAILDIVKIPNFGQKDLSKWQAVEKHTWH